MLRFAARHGKWCLVAGLIAGITLPDLAVALRPYLPILIAGLLFVAAFRIGPGVILDTLQSTRDLLGLVVVFQVGAPLMAVLLFSSAGLLGTTAALAVVLMLSAPSVTGSANFALILKVRPEAALRLLMVGTALFPITVIPVLLLVPALDFASVIRAALRLLMLVSFAGGLAFLLRRVFARDLSPLQAQNLDGMSAILLGVVVIGLMSAAGPLLMSAPFTFGAWLLLAFGVNFSAQLLAWFSLNGRVPQRDRAANSIVAGNRNIALFLVALPPSLTDELLSFIGCYQIPMYLTPILLRRLYAK